MQAVHIHLVEEQEGHILAGAGAAVAEAAEAVDGGYRRYIAAG